MHLQSERIFCIIVIAIRCKHRLDNGTAAKEGWKNMKAFTGFAIGALAVIGAAAAAGIYLKKKTEKEDEYEKFEDIMDSEDDFDAFFDEDDEVLDDKAEDIAEAVEEKAEDAAEAVKDAVSDIADEIKDVTE